MMLDTEIVDKLYKLTQLLLDGAITKDEHSDQVVTILFIDNPSRASKVI